MSIRLQELETTLAYWVDKAKRVRRDPDSYGTTQPQVCARQIRQLRQLIKDEKAARKFAAAMSNEVVE